MNSGQDKMRAFPNVRSQHVSVTADPYTKSSRDEVNEAQK